MYSALSPSCINVVGRARLPGTAVDLYLLPAVSARHGLEPKTQSSYAASFLPAYTHKPFGIAAPLSRRISSRSSKVTTVTYGDFLCVLMVHGRIG